MLQKIQTALQKLEKERNIKILYACESGSRAWGFPSPDSDYDVRFIYIRPIDWYLSINEKTDHITLPLDPDNLDIVGWDIRKVLGLMRKSNASIFAWMLSPIVYHNEKGFLERLQELAPQYFAPRAAIHHYLGLTRKIVQTELQKERVNIKKYFYVLRPLLCAKWIAERKEAPPMEFQNLLPLIEGNEELMEVIEDLLERKEKALEGAYIQRVPLIHDFAEQELTNLHQMAKDLPKTQPDGEPLNEWFRDLLKE
ncbi:MAG: nucleotidyltransferase domain-containing protein [Chitinophagales bacterium]